MASVQRVWLETIRLGRNERRDYTHNWAPTLVPIEDTIAQMRCFVNDPKTGDELTGPNPGLDIYNESFTPLDCTMWLQNPTPGGIFAATFLIVTNKERIFEGSIRVIGILR